MPITGLYAGLLALVALFLWLRVSGLRMQARISTGDGGNLALADRIRRHGNFAEHVPLALILLGILERDGTRPVVLHALGATLVVARILHPLGLRHDRIPHPLRAAGAFATFAVTLAGALLALSSSLRALF
jgi:uncharacterized membrane protein YecN with MAPEG domain